jgi:hypothetical protein
MTTFLAVVGGVYLFATFVVAMAVVGARFALWWLDRRPQEFEPSDQFEMPDFMGIDYAPEHDAYDRGTSG